MKNFVQKRNQIPVVVDGQCTSCEAMRARAFHFPKRDIILTVHRLVSLRRNRFREYNQKPIAIRFADPIELFRCRLRRAPNASQHNHDRGMRR